LKKEMVRLKHRYLIAQILPLYQRSSGTDGSNQKIISINRILELVRQKILELYGEMGIGDFGQQLVIKYYEHEYSRILVIKVPRGCQKHVQLALSCISTVDDVPLIIRTLHTSSCPRTCLGKLTPLIKRYVEFNPKVKHAGVEDQLLKTMTNALSES
jgi:RNase P/RNase MRP subunit POP5